jgi:peptide/nickel transport system permease protein
MTRAILIRLALLLPVLLGVSLIVFLTMTLVPGDPALAILGPYATPDTIASLRESMGLDRPLPEQYLIWLGNILRGDFGWSYSLDRPVADEIAQRLGPTLLLAGAALVLSVAVGVTAGVAAAVYRSDWRGEATRFAALLAISVPPFWLGLMLVLLVSVRLGWLPVSGMVPVHGAASVSEVARHLVLPALTLAVVAAGVIARFARVAMLEVLPFDYVRAARAKGLPEPDIIWSHAFRNALVPLLPVIGTQIGFLLGGTVYVETVFQWPGLGRALVDAILARDLLLVQGGVLVLAALFVVLNLLIDLGQRWLDPRIGP